MHFVKRFLLKKKCSKTKWSIEFDWATLAFREKLNIYQKNNNKLELAPKVYIRGGMSNFVFVVSSSSHIVITFLIMIGK